MIIYKNNKNAFIQHCKANEISEILKKNLKSKMNINPTISEMRSWQNSLTMLAFSILSDDSIPDDLGIGLEYNLQSSKLRIDLLLSGFDINNKNNLLMVEIKQWEFCESIPNSDSVVRTRLGKGVRETTHPAYQIYSYWYYLRNFVAVLQDDFENSIDVQVKTCVWMHNYLIENGPELLANQYSEYNNQTQIYTKKDNLKFIQFIKDNIAFGDNGKAIDTIEKSPYKASGSIQDFLKEIIDGNDDFALIDQQRIIYDKCSREVIKSINDKSKKVIIIPGPPGTGKTIIALKLLSNFIQKNIKSIYVSKNQSLRDGYESILLSKKNDQKKYSKVQIASFFKGSSIFSNLDKNSYDCSIVDEAHRLIKRSQYTPKNKGYNNQIREIICESRVSIFFIDEKQIVTTKDIGTIKEIKKCALEEGINPNNIIEITPLEMQFRSSGSDDYIKWVDNILYGEKNQIEDFSKDFKLEVLDSINSFHEKIKHKNTKNNARILAGYCWNWISNKNPSLFDIKIEDFSIQWNLKNDSKFMFSESSFNQAGCIHTSQGLEKDYIGVIIGEDLIFRDGKIQTNFKKRAKTDKSLIGIKSLPQDEAADIYDTIIKNTYRVLMTRASKGCYIYCVDEELRKYLSIIIAKLSI